MLVFDGLPVASVILSRGHRPLVDCAIINAIAVGLLFPWVASNDNQQLPFFSNQAITECPEGFGSQSQSPPGL